MGVELVILEMKGFVVFRQAVEPTFESCELVVLNSLSVLIYKSVEAEVIQRSFL